MVNVSAQSTTTPLRLTRTLAAPREEVFRAWTQPKAMVRWFAPSDEFVVVVPELDLRIGGSYRIEMHHASGPIHRVVGAYREIDAPRRLAFTWRWLETEMEDSLVTIDLRQAGAMTELVLTHGGLGVGSEAAAKHQHGWLGCFERLERLLAKQQAV
jgi:uncharacterized protein YndB with AHSA1/START domain